MNGAKKHIFGIGILYLMVNVPRLWQWKTGITGVGIDRRAKSIDAEMPGFPLPVFFCVTPFAHTIEQSLHELYRPLHSPFYRGSGWTEWFLFPSAVCTFTVQVGVWVAEVLAVDYFCGTRIFEFVTNLIL